MIKNISLLVRSFALFLGSTLFGVTVTFIAFLYYHSETLPDLNSWHLIELENEFRASDTGAVTSFVDYLSLEQQLFNELEEKLYQHIPDDEQSAASRFTKTSPVDPSSYPTNWNRTQELPVANPKAGCLLVHGLSDSPYSVHNLAITLQRHHCWAIALRLPGHGTAPAGLLSVNNDDLKQAVRLAARHLHNKTGGNKPLYFIGYSTGASLAVDYSLAKAEGESLPGFEKMVLLSPAIGLPKVAALAVWQRRIAYLPGLEELGWNAVLPEFDPYKYNSFTINAAEQVYDLTVDLKQRIKQLEHEAQLSSFPPVLAFLSAVDATVSAHAVIDDFLLRLPSNHHKLVVYDINRSKYSPFLFATAANETTQHLLDQKLPFKFTLLTNKSPDSSEVMLIDKFSNTLENNLISNTKLVWPTGLYSLSHTALPFPPGDPVYGNGKLQGTESAALGNITLRGERGVLRIPASQLIRLRYNPFYDFQEAQVLAFLNLAPGGASEQNTEHLILNTEH